MRWSYGPLPTTLLETLILVTVALYVAGRVQEGTLRFHRTPLDIPVALLLLSGLIAIGVAHDHRAALGLYRAYFVEPIAVFYVAFDLIREERDFRRLLIGLAAGSSAFALLNVGNFIVVLAQNRIQWGAPPSAIYTSSNEVAMYLEPPLAFATAAVFLSPRQMDRKLGAAWAACLVVALILTISRAAYLAVAVFAALTIVTLVRSFRKPLLIAIGAGVLLLIAVAVLGDRVPLGSKLSLTAFLYTSETRGALYTATLQLMSHHPLFGVGLGGYRVVLHGFPEIYPHDLWLSFWVELGALGVLAFAFIFFWLLVTAWRGFHGATGFVRVVLWGTLGTLVLWGVHGLFDTPYWKNDMSVEFWLVAATQLAALSRTRGWRALTEWGWRGYRAPANEPSRPEAGAHGG